jgi:hypothetical protein
MSDDLGDTETQPVSGVPLLEVSSDEIAEDAYLPKEEDEARAARDEADRLFAQIEGRCKDGGIGCKRADDFDGNSILRLAIPAGHEPRPLVVRGQSEARALLGVDFEHWRYLEGYEAIYSYEDEEIEAAVRFVRPMSRRMLDRVFPTTKDENGAEVQHPSSLPSLGRDPAWNSG